MNAVTCYIKFDDKIILVMMGMVCFLGHKEAWLSEKLNIVIILLYTQQLP